MAIRVKSLANVKLTGWVVGSCLGIFYDRGLMIALDGLVIGANRIYSKINFGILIEISKRNF